MARSGVTDVTSVSISQEFSKLLKEYKLSPTEVFRKGMAVSLYDLGVYQYQSTTNKKRSEFTKEFLAEYEKNNKLQKIFFKIAELNKIIEEVVK